MMTPPPDRDRTEQLRHWMQQVGLSSFKALSQTAGVSEKQIRRLRQGQLNTMRLETLVQLSHALQVPVTTLLTTFSQDILPTPTSHPEPGAAVSSDPLASQVTLATLQQEYDRLQATLTQQQTDLWHTFQQESLHLLESLILQLPTAAYAAQQNPQAPAVKLLPLLRPLDALLHQWGIEPIATVGAEISYDPQWHQLMDGQATVGDRVRVRYVGYRQGDRLLYRAKVSPVQ